MNLKKFNITISFFNHVSFVDKLLFTKHLAILIKSGIPLPEALTILIDQTKSSTLSHILISIDQEIKNGSSLSDALKKHPKVFDSFYTSLIQVSEKSGTLEKNLDYLSLQLNKDYAVRKKVQAALLYPSIVIASTLIMGGFITFFILPKLLDFFTSFDAQLPLATRILIFIAAVFQQYGLFILIGFAALFVLFIFLLRIPPIRTLWHRFLLKAPIIGPIVLDSNLALFSRNLGIMLQAGLPITTAFEIITNSINNYYLKSLLSKARNEIESGNSLNQTFSNPQYAVFPLIVTKMIGVGEKTGKLDETLIYLSEFYEEELDTVSQNLTTLLEPILLVTIGLAVGFVALAIISPIYDLTSSITL